jgi:hypothetical protein
MVELVEMSSRHDSFPNQICVQVNPGPDCSASTSSKPPTSVFTRQSTC